MCIVSISVHEGSGHDVCSLDGDTDGEAHHISLFMCESIYICTFTHIYLSLYIYLSLSAHEGSRRYDGCLDGDTDGEAHHLCLCMCESIYICTYTYLSIYLSIYLYPLMKDRVIMFAPSTVITMGRLITSLSLCARAYTYTHIHIYLYLYISFYIRT